MIRYAIKRNIDLNDFTKNWHLIPIDTMVPFCHYSRLMMTVISSERITARVSAQIKQTLTDAANLSGATLNQFLVQAMFNTSVYIFIVKIN